MLTMPVARGSRSAPVHRHVRESKVAPEPFHRRPCREEPGSVGPPLAVRPVRSAQRPHRPPRAGRPAPSGDHPDREPGQGGAPSLPQAEARARPRQPASVRARTGGTGSRRAPCRGARRIRRRAGVAREGGGPYPGHAAGRTRAARRALPPRPRRHCEDRAARGMAHDRGALRPQRAQGTSVAHGRLLSTGTARERHADDPERQADRGEVQLRCREPQAMEGSLSRPASAPLRGRSGEDGGPRAGGDTVRAPSGPARRRVAPHHRRRREDPVVLGASRVPAPLRPVRGRHVPPLAGTLPYAHLAPAQPAPARAARGGSRRGAGASAAPQPGGLHPPGPGLAGVHAPRARSDGWFPDAARRFPAGRLHDPGRRGLGAEPLAESGERG